MLKITKMELVDMIFNNTEFVIKHVEHKMHMESDIATACKKKLYAKPAIINAPWYLISGVDTAYDPRLKERIAHLFDIFLQSKDYEWYSRRSTISKSCIRKIVYDIFSHMQLCLLHKKIYSGYNIKWVSMRVQYELLASLHCNDIMQLNSSKEDGSFYCTLTTSYYRTSLNNMPILLGILMTAIQLGALKLENISILAHNIQPFALLYQVYEKFVLNKYAKDDIINIKEQAMPLKSNKEQSMPLMQNIPVQASLHLELGDVNKNLQQWVVDSIAAQLEKHNTRQSNKTYMANPLAFVNGIINDLNQ